MLFEIYIYVCVCVCVCVYSLFKTCFQKDYLKFFFQKVYLKFVAKISLNLTKSSNIFESLSEIDNLLIELFRYTPSEVFETTMPRFDHQLHKGL